MDVLGEGQRASGEGRRQCQMRGAEALGSENRGARRGWEAGSPPTALGACACARTGARACVRVRVHVRLGGQGRRRCVEQRRGEGCRVSLRDPVAKMELWLLDSHRVIGWLWAGLGMPVRNSHAHPPAPPSCFGILLSLAWVPRDSKAFFQGVGFFRTAGRGWGSKD